MVIFIAWIASISSQQKTNMNLVKKCENKDFCDIIMSSEDFKILDFNQYQKSDKIPCIINADLESLIEMTDWYENNPEKLSTTKVVEHTPSDYSMLTI